MEVSKFPDKDIVVDDDEVPPQPKKRVHLKNPDRVETPSVEIQMRAIKRLEQVELEGSEETRKEKCTKTTIPLISTTITTTAEEADHDKVHRLVLRKKSRVLKTHLKRWGVDSLSFRSNDGLSVLSDFTQQATSGDVKLPGVEFAASTHVFTSTSPTSVCSANTRIAKLDLAIKAFRRPSRKQRQRMNKKETKINSITGYDIIADNVIDYKKYNNKLYFIGNPTGCVPNLPKGSFTKCPTKDLHAINLIYNDKNHGARMANVFKLLPRKEIVVNANHHKNYYSYYQLFSTLLDHNKATVQRGKTREVGFENATDKKYLCFGDQVSRAKKGIKPNIEGINEEHYRKLSKFVNYVEFCIKGYLESHFLSAMHLLRNRLEYLSGILQQGNPEAMNSSIAFSKNSYLNIHTDQDFGMSTMIVLGDKPGKLQNDSQVLLYMCFPSQGVSVALRHGDILLFNPLVPHGASSRVSDECDVIILALYTKTAHIGGNDNSKSISHLFI
jgi:hypothetical protein